MNDIFHQLFNAKPAEQAAIVLVHSVCRMNPFELDRAAADLDDQQKLKVSIAVADRVRGHSTLSSLEIGALLKLFLLVTPDKSRAEAFATMEEETGIKRTQLYRSIDMFDCFGQTLLNERDVAARCTCEALKLLSEKSVLDETREQALKYARGGKHLTIKVAQKLRRKQSESRVVQQAALRNAGDGGRETKMEPISKAIADSDAIWKFSDSNLIVVVQHNPNGAPIGAEEIIIGLEAALAKARQEYVVNKQEPQPV